VFVYSNEVKDVRSIDESGKDFSMSISTGSKAMIYLSIVRLILAKFQILLRSTAKCRMDSLFGLISCAKGINKFTIEAGNNLE
jgi:hypothetical protein